MTANTAFASSAMAREPLVLRHTATVRWTHWITTFCFFALLWSGVNILISHPRFYWGESGNVSMEPWLSIPIPSSRGSVQTGYGYVLKDQNGWSRSLHFQSAWLLFFAALAYGWHGLRSRHFADELLPRGLAGFGAALGKHLWERPAAREAWSYNLVQRAAYSAVVFGLVPLMFWTGLAMSPGFTAGFPWTVQVLGGTQSARTIHFLVTVVLTLFVLTHVAMVWRAGLVSRVRAMLSGRIGPEEGA
jgi:thiosulfate reductase cytochrome b subunit